MKTVALLLLTVLSPMAFGQSRMRYRTTEPFFYETDFPSVENPISEGGQWLNGGTVGLDWSDVEVSPSGRAVGTQNGLPNYYSDSTAILARAGWPANQYAQGTVYRAVGNTNEVELRLRSTMTANSNPGYEVLFTDTNMQVVRWNGPLGDFDFLGGTGSGGGAANGDVVRAEISGEEITVYRNGVLIWTVDDPSGIASGSPGFGFFISILDPCTFDPEVNADFGFTHFEAGVID